MMDRIDRIRQSFITRRRETDQTDTHDYIQRHEPDFDKQNHRHSKQTSSVDEEDMTDISVESLIIFLHGLKKDTQTTPAAKTKPTDPKTAKAISAYGSQDPQVTKRYTYLNDDDQNIDIDMVDRLITGLEDLKENNIEHITLEQADGFLQSLEKTVEKYRSL